MMHPVSVQISAEERRRYYCLKGKYHVVDGAKMVAILFTTYFGLTAVLSIVQLVHSAPTNTSVSLVGVICVGCLWCGLQKRKEALLLPFLLYLGIWLVCTAVGMGILAAMAVLWTCTVSNAEMDKYRAQVMDDPYLSKNPIVSWLMNDPSKMTFVLLAILVIGCVFFILLSWAFVVVNKAHNYIRDERMNRLYDGPLMTPATAVMVADPLGPMDPRFGPAPDYADVEQHGFKQGVFDVPPPGYDEATKAAKEPMVA